MVDRFDGTDGKRKDSLQDVELSRMQGPVDESFQITGGSRMLDFNKMRLINVHIKARKGHVSAECGFCKSGMASVLGEVEETFPEREARMAESTRVDEERAATSTRSDGPGGILEEDALLWRREI